MNLEILHDLIKNDLALSEYLRTNGLLRTNLSHKICKQRMTEDSYTQ